jgi:hypothetical protein
VRSRKREESAREVREGKQLSTEAAESTIVETDCRASYQAIAAKQSHERDADFVFFSLFCLVSLVVRCRGRDTLPQASKQPRECQERIRRR